MRLALVTRHRRLVILTGDDAEDDDEPALVVNTTAADLAVPFGFTAEESEEAEVSHVDRRAVGRRRAAP